MQKVKIVSGEFTFLGELQEQNAPKTCEAFLAMLPITEKVIHVRWSGEGFWIPYGNTDMGVPFENATSHPSKGEVLLYPGGISEAEIIFAYGSCCFSSKAGQLAGNHFLTIQGDLDLLYSFGRKILLEGAQEITISALPE